jgi:hypothetical protein
MKVLISVSFLLISLNLSAQKENMITCKWNDGSGGSSFPAASDYTSIKKGQVLYCISNDDRNIYVDMKVTESTEQNKILQMGMVLWVNNDGKSRKVNGVRFPIGAKFSRSRNGNGQGQGNNPYEQATPLSLANTIELIGFKDILEKKFPSNNTDNIRSVIKYDNDGNLVYALTLPLSKLPVVARNTDGKAFPLNLAIEYGAPPEMEASSGKPAGYTPPPSHPVNGGSGKSGGGGGGGARGGSGGSSRTAGALNNEDVPKSVIIWLKGVNLAEKK